MVWGFLGSDGYRLGVWCELPIIHGQPLACPRDQASKGLEKEDKESGLCPQGCGSVAPSQCCPWWTGGGGGVGHAEPPCTTLSTAPRGSRVHTDPGRLKDVMK